MKKNDKKLADALAGVVDVLADEQQRAANGQFGSGGGTSGTGSKVAQVHAKNKAAGLTQPSLKEREAKESAERQKAKTQTAMTPEQTKKAQAEHHASVKEKRLATQALSASRKYTTLASAKSAAATQKYPVPILHGEKGQFLVPSSVKEASALMKAGHEKAM